MLDDPSTGHNRFHPDIEPLLVVAPGDVVSVDVRDGFDAQIGRDSRPEDIYDLDLERGHAMSGPIAVEGAEPGDLLEVEILEIETGGFGFSMIMPGIGLLGQRFDRPFLVKWDLADGRARSHDIPGVAIRGRPFLGLVAVAPSQEFMRTATAREQALAGEHIVLLPAPTRAVPRHAGLGLRTLPPRENGGNLDVRHLVAGARVRLVVQVPGALLSVGDAHFAQGDGESSGVAIETSARVRLRLRLHKTPTWRPRHPFITVGKHVVATGISVDAAGENRYLDVNTAAAAAAEDMLEYLRVDRGLSAEQAYVLLSVAVNLQISELVDAPNAVVSAVLPPDVFD